MTYDSPVRRWSIMVYETKFPRQHSVSTVTEDCSEDSEVTPGRCGAACGSPVLSQCGLVQVQQILTYEDSVAAHLSKILTSDQHSVVISSAKYARLPVSSGCLGWWDCTVTQYPLCVSMVTGFSAKQ